MIVRNLNPHSQSEKIIKNGNISFKLWLEFEISSPWNDLENDFANISVNTLDGRQYGINVWTYKFLESAVKHDKKSGENLNGLYLTPPDLFVKELTRSCIEKTIIDLLEKGNLEEELNESTFGLDFIEPYLDAIEMEEETIQAYTNELKLQLPENHILKKKAFDAIAQNTYNNDIVLRLKNRNIVVVQSNWKSQITIGEFPIIRTYINKLDFWKNEMKQNIIDFKSKSAN